MRSKKIIIGGLAGIAAASLAISGFLMLNGNGNDSGVSENGFRGVYNGPFTAFAAETEGETGTGAAAKLYSSRGMKSVGKDHLLIVTAFEAEVSDYSKVGYEISVDGADAIKSESNKYYTGVSVRTSLEDESARKSYTVAEIYAGVEDFNAEYIIGTEIEYSVNSAYVIKPYMVPNEGETVYGAEITIDKYEVTVNSYSADGSSLIVNTTLKGYAAADVSFKMQELSGWTDLSITTESTEGADGTVNFALPLSALKDSGSNSCLFKICYGGKEEYLSNSGAAFTAETKDAENKLVYTFDELNGFLRCSVNDYSATVNSYSADGSSLIVNTTLKGYAAADVSFKKTQLGSDWVDSDLTVGYTEEADGTVNFALPLSALEIGDKPNIDENGGTNRYLFKICYDGKEDYLSNPDAAFTAETKNMNEKLVYTIDDLWGFLRCTVNDYYPVVEDREGKAYFIMKTTLSQAVAEYGFYTIEMPDTGDWVRNEVAFTATQLADGSYEIAVDISGLAGTNYLLGFRLKTSDESFIAYTMSGTFTAGGKVYTIGELWGNLKLTISEQ